MNQWIRKIGLIVFEGSTAMDLSAFRVRFRIRNADEEAPNNAAIRVYNLAPDTVRRIRGEFSQVVLNAGYEFGNYGVVFQGTIKQFHIGKENATDTFLDILASDGDIQYNQGIVNKTLAAGSTPADEIAAITSAMSAKADTTALLTDPQHIPSIRGSVMFGMAKARMRNVATWLDASWSIQNGKVVVLPYTGYSPGEVVQINVGTGLIGVPEQTDEGIKLRCLLNSRLRIGGRVQLNNSEVLQLVAQDKNAPFNMPYDQWAGIQFLAPLSPDGVYRAYVVEHNGDTRGPEWYSELTCLAVKPSAPPSKAVAGT